MKKFDDDLKVLMYGDLGKLESTMNQQFLNQLINVSDEITEKPRTIFELNNFVEKEKFTHLIIPDEWFHRLEGTLENCKVPIVELLGDHWIPWAIDKKKTYLTQNKIKDAIVFSNRFKEPYEEVVKMHAVLNGYDNSTFYDKEGKRDIDILINGSLGEDTHKWVYPIRNWLHEVIPEIGIKEGLKVKYWKHPGYWPEKINEPRENFTELYADILNHSKIAIGGTSHWQLTLRKFYEIPACGTILLSDLPLEDRAFFEKRIIEIDRNKINSRNYEDKLRRKIMGVLENYEIEKQKLNPFRSKKDIFNKSYDGRSLEIRALLKNIQK